MLDAMRLSIVAILAVLATGCYSVPPWCQCCVPVTDTASDGGGGAASTTSGSTGGEGGRLPDAGADAPAPVVRGAVFIHTANPDPVTCGIASNKAAIGFVGDSTASPVEDGHGASVACSLKPAFDGHVAVDASVSSGSTYARLTIPDLSLVDQQNSVIGTIHVSAGFLAGEDYTGQCQVWFGDQQWMTPTTLWVSFACDGISNGAHVCPVSEGYAYFDGCTDS